MPLTIPDDQLARIDLTPEALRLEIAVMLREKDKLDWRPAARLAGVDLGTFLDVLRERGVPMIHAGGTTEEQALEYLRQEHGFRVNDRGDVSLDPAVFPNLAGGRSPDEAEEETPSPEHGVAPVDGVAAARADRVAA